MNAAELDFKHLTIDGKSSIAGDISDVDARGIYVYKFEDGTCYVGKSEDVRKRYVQHAHEYRHMKGSPKVAEMLFAHISGDNPEVLDRAETDAIAWFGSHGWDLRNIMKTDLPGGAGEMVIGADKFGVPVPWDRRDIDHGATVSYKFDDDEAKRRRFEELERFEIGLEVEKCLGAFVRALIPRPAVGAGILWTVTALPSTARRTRAATLSCQNLEVLVIGRDGSGFINGKDVPDEKLEECIKHDMAPMKRAGWRFRGNTIVAPNGQSARRLARPAEYANADNVFSLEFENLDQLNLLLRDPLTLLWSYRLVAELLRRGPSMYRKFNNPYLAAKVLHECPSIFL